MDTPLSGIEIAVQSFRVGRRFFEPCDKIEDTGLDQRSFDTLRQQRYFAPLTRERYRDLIKTRPPGTIGRGFTVASLVALGVLDRSEAKAQPAAEPVPLAEDTIEYRGNLIRGYKAGHFKHFEALNRAGEMLRPKRFKSVDLAKNWLDANFPGNSTDSGSSGNAGEPETEEDPDGVHIQPDTGDAGGSDSSESR